MLFELMLEETLTPIALVNNGLKVEVGQFLKMIGATIQMKLSILKTIFFINLSMLAKISTLNFFLLPVVPMK